MKVPVCAAHLQFEIGDIQLCFGAVALSPVPYFAEVIKYEGKRHAYLAAAGLPTSLGARPTIVLRELCGAATAVASSAAAIRRPMWVTNSTLGVCRERGTPTRLQHGALGRASDRTCRQISLLRQMIRFCGLHKYSFKEKDEEKKSADVPYSSLREVLGHSRRKWAPAREPAPSRQSTAYAPDR